jgi:hypothetical protein
MLPRAGALGPGQIAQPGKRVDYSSFMKNSDVPLATPVMRQSRPRKHLTPDTQGPASRQTGRAAGIGAPRTWFRRGPFLIGVAALLGLGGCANRSTISLEGKPISGYVRMNEVQAAYIGSGNAGSGVLYYQGGRYPFTVGGLGVGGIGLSKIEAKGDVYGLKNVRDFAGAYAQGRYGFAVGNASAGDLWLQNGNGVVMHLVAKRQGLMLSLGGDAVVIEMNQ